ncbi:phage tail protein [Laribacter hongkongensis]|uniref:phage tail protein n=1 Tax=Laribacter hongkongensis TaxID=168471 RepID=UPI001EFE032C|nr:phage tail protein [Laribacter hongkongensis]MCG9105635.1 phage tail protein [Laribacter hongkongensis]
MPQEFFSTLTVVGESRLASAAALGSSLQLTHLAVGDGGGVRVMPTPAQTKLVREVRRAPVNRVETDPANPGQIIIEQVIPETEGGWWIREIGVFDKYGNLIAVGNCPDTYKPLLAEGSGRTQVIRMVLIVSSTDAVTLKVDPSVVLATKQHVTETVAKAVSDHLAQPDPHPQYLTEAEGKQRIDAAVAALVAGAPGALDTLKELSDALGGDRNFSATVMNMIDGKLGKTDAAADSSRLGGQLPGYYAAASSLALPFAAVPYPAIATAENRIPVAASAVAGTGGTVTMPPDIMISMAEEVIPGKTARYGTYTTVAWTSANLDVGSTYYMRAQVVNGVLTFYVQKGTDADTIPASRKGSANGANGGGFDSTCIDMLVAKIVTGAAGSMPAVTQLANARRLTFKATAGYTYSRTCGASGNTIAQPPTPFLLNWARMPVEYLAVVGFSRAGTWNHPEGVQILYAGSSADSSGTFTAILNRYQFSPVAYFDANSAAASVTYGAQFDVSAAA